MKSWRRIQPFYLLQRPKSLQGIFAYEHAGLIENVTYIGFDSVPELLSQIQRYGIGLSDATKPTGGGKDVATGEADDKTKNYTNSTTNDNEKEEERMKTLTVQRIIQAAWQVANDKHSWTIRGQEMIDSIRNQQQAHHMSCSRGRR